MEKFIVSFQYMDGETFELEVHPDDMENFMACVGKSEVFFNQSRGVGVWVPVDKIRYFQVEKVDEDGNRVIEKPKAPVVIPAEALEEEQPERGVE